MLLSQRDDPAVLVGARERAAERLGLEFGHEHTGLAPFAAAVAVGLTRRVA